MAAQFTVDTERIAGAAGDIARISAEIEGQVATMMARPTAFRTRGPARRRRSSRVSFCVAARSSRCALAGLHRPGAGAAGTQYADVEAAATRMFTS